MLIQDYNREAISSEDDLHPKRSQKRWITKGILSGNRLQDINHSVHLSRILPADQFE